MNASELRSLAIVTNLYSVQLDERSKRADRTLEERNLAALGSDAALALVFEYACQVQNVDRGLFSCPETCTEPAPLRDEGYASEHSRQAASSGPPLRRAGEGWFWAGMVAALGLAFVALLGMAP